MKTFSIDESLIFGAVSFERTDAGLRPWRIPFEEYSLFETHPNCKFESLQQSASETAGVRLQFSTNSQRVALKTGGNNTAKDQLFDLVINNELLQSAKLEPGTSDIVFSDLPAGDKDVHIWLPMDAAVELVELSVDDDLSPVNDTRLKWITHGSSITHCRGAYSPARTWPAIVARERDLNLMSLGFGAGCHLDQHTARIIRDMKADFISLKIGINIIIVGSLGWRTFKPAVTGFLRTIREKRETTPIAILSPIIAPGFEDSKNCVNMTLREMRVELADAVERHKQVTGDENIRFFDGLNLLPQEEIGKMDGFLHPDGREYEIMGRNFVTQVYDNLMR